MRNIDTYITEKLIINKDSEDTLDKAFLVKEICFHVKHCLEDDYNISNNKYVIYTVDEQKCLTNEDDKTWYVGVDINTNNERLPINILTSLRASLKNIVDKNNISGYVITNNKRYAIKIFLYDPE